MGDRPGEGHLGAGGVLAPVHVYGNQGVTAADLHLDAAGPAQAVSGEHPKGPGGVAAELPAGHLHPGRPAVGGGADEADLLDVGAGHQTGGKSGPVP